MTPESLRAYVDYGVRDRGEGVFELKCRPDVEASIYTRGPLNGAWAKLPPPPPYAGQGGRVRGGDPRGNR